ncbi:hypothetical protein TNCV_1779631 [Trichonephila clavipes]|nr:hypothetical protein TNCV_1779631 [Trichonephila clavipes]
MFDPTGCATKASYAEDLKKTSSNCRFSIVRAEEHVREASPAVLMAKATIPVTTPIKEEKEIDEGCLRQGQM